MKIEDNLHIGLVVSVVAGKYEELIPIEHTISSSFCSKVNCLPEFQLLID